MGRNAVFTQRGRSVDAVRGDCGGRRCPLISAVRSDGTLRVRVVLVGFGITRALGPGSVPGAVLEEQYERTGGGVRLGAQSHGEVQRRLATGIGRAHLDVLLLEQQPHL